MRRVTALYFEAEPPSVIAGIESAAVRTRLDVLRYGYGARTRAVLESHFPRLKAALSQEDWESWGSTFAERHAPDAPYLGLLALRFREWVKARELMPPVRQALALDAAVFDCTHAKHSPAVTQLAELAVGLSLQPSVNVVAEEGDAWVVSRNRTRIFVERVDLEIQRALERLARSGHQELESAVDWFSGEKPLALFLELGIRNHWFRQEPEDTPWTSRSTARSATR